jgi:Amt family ammonium transporter
MQEAAEIAGGSWTVFQQLGVQLVAILIAIVYAAFGTWLILIVLSRFMNIRATEEAENKGLDSYFHGEKGYGMINPN